MTFDEVKARRLFLHAQMLKIQVELGKLVAACPHRWTAWRHTEGEDSPLDSRDARSCDACDHLEETTCTSASSCFEGRKL